ncbi:membrane protein [Nocardioides panacihumi]|uniref:Membrane protein n=1 Tax=Nocardioides panacihumi TaxID=400774 RepID=A0ABN2QCE3_9ACTN
MSATIERRDLRMMLNKVPEVTIWFWIIKILCTSVGESFADYINETLGFGLVNTTVLFGVLLVGALVVQFRTRAYTPWIYWLTVVLVSVEGTLLTDNLTDGMGVPLWISSTAFAALLVAVFGAWYARERTLSIHAINTRSREGWYWLTVLVTFALGTATGDWTLELTGWAPGTAVLLPLGLILATIVAWRAGVNPVLTFWIAYILTRPLGANIGDFLASDKSEGGLGLGTLVPSVGFLAAILAVVVYLSVSKVDRTEEAAPLEPDEPDEMAA